MNALSLPSRECGLKSFCLFPLPQIKWSLPSRECGLKFLEFLKYMTYANVTPFAGVWIEIHGLL